MPKPTPSPKLTAALALLPGLTVVELGEVKARIDLLTTTLGKSLANTADAGRALDVRQIDWLLEGILAALRERGLGGAVPLPNQLAKLKTFKFYSEHSVAIRDVYERAVPSTTMAERLALGSIIGAVYVEHVIHRHRTSQLSILLGRIESIHDAVEDAFPGYLASGMMVVLLRTRRDAVLSR